MSRSLIRHAPLGVHLYDQGLFKIAGPSLSLADWGDLSDRRDELRGLWTILQNFEVLVVLAHPLSASSALVGFPGRSFLPIQGDLIFCYLSLLAMYG